MRQVEIFDSTLRDGAQGENISFTVEDKLRILKYLDKLGIRYAEAGNPSSNPKDMEFFERAAQLELQTTKLVAFGSTCRRGQLPEEDKSCAQLLSAGTSIVTIFGKSSEFHVNHVLQTSLEENLRMISDTVSFLRMQGKQVFFDAEHFFDGYKLNPNYALDTLRAAVKAGAERLVLCDTNGGCFPHEISKITSLVVAEFGKKVGIHCHNDCGCAVANSLAAVQAGAVQVQGTYLGFGERCGNANLSTIIPCLQLKLGISCIPEEKLIRLTKTARYIAEIANHMLPAELPFVGKSAFAHKGGMHVDGVNKISSSFEHIPPETVGNHRNILISEVSGRTAILNKITEIDSTLTKESEKTQELMDLLKEMEHQGYQYESAVASFELMVLKQLGRLKPQFTIETFKVIGEQTKDYQSDLSSAMVKVKVDEQYEITADEGEGPVNALDKALRKALEVFYPVIAQMRLIDYKVRVMEPKQATAAKVRVFIESTDGENVWTTVGVSTDIINASFKALTDSIEYKLYKYGEARQE